jgi:hypothetical protein
MLTALFKPLLLCWYSRLEDTHTDASLDVCHMALPSW